MNTYSSVDIVNILKNEGFSISKRTFTYYASDKKILPQPTIHNNRKRYTDYHLEYLKALMILKDKGDTLSEIKESLDQLDIDELKLISQTYKPFTSQEMINDVKSAYQTTYQSNSSMDSFSSHSNSMYRDNYTATSLVSNSSMLSNNDNNLDLNLNTQVENYSNMKRTVVNENVILETKNIDSKTLAQLIKEIDSILNN